MIVSQNSEFLFLFEAVMTNPNGDPDQENRPRMDYETQTALVSDARRKRDVRDFLKLKGYPIFVDTLADKKVTMSAMFEVVINRWLEKEAFSSLLREEEEVKQAWLELGGIENEDYRAKYESAKKDAKKDKKKNDLFTQFNNLFLTAIIKKSLIDIRLFGSAMAVEDVTRTYTGPVQISWGYSLHPVELVKSNTITSIMNDDASTFGKKHKLHYGLFAHYGTINKFNAARTGMTEEDRQLFRKALIQGMMNNLTDSKQGQTPLYYLEIVYEEGFDGYLGDLRRYLQVDYAEDRPIRSLKDLRVDFAGLNQILGVLKDKGRIKEVIQWIHPFVSMESLLHLPDAKEADLIETVTA